MLSIPSKANLRNGRGDLQIFPVCTHLECLSISLEPRSLPYQGGIENPPWVTCQKSYPPSSQYLCAKDRISEARPLPSQMTTGTGGSSRRYSKTTDITLGPPSTTSPTTGTPCPSPATQTTVTAHACMQRLHLKHSEEETLQHCVGTKRWEGFRHGIISPVSIQSSYHGPFGKPRTSKILNFLTPPMGQFPGVLFTPPPPQGDS